MTVEPERRLSVPAHATGAVEFVPLEAIADDPTFRLREEGDVALLAASIGRLGQLVPVELRPVPGAAEDAPRYQMVAGFRRLAALRMLARERVLARVHDTLDDDDAWGLALGLALLAEPLLANELEALRERLAAEGLAPWAEELVEEALARAPVDARLRERFLAYLARGERAEGGEGDAPDEEADGASGDGGAPPESAAAAADEAEAEREPARAAPGEAGDMDADAAGEADAAAEPDAPAASDDAGDEPGGGEATLEVTPEELAADLAGRMYDVNQDLAVAYESWAELPPEGRRMIVEQARYVAEVLRLLEEEGG